MRDINKSAYHAFKDIRSELDKQKAIIMDSNNDVWFVTGNSLYTKENRRLNKEIGVTKLNMKGGR